MAGSKQSKETLNRTLLFIATLFNDNGIKDWFIAYGTLLGIIRGGSCIDKDDDVDIVTNKTNYDIIRKILIDNGFVLTNCGNKNKDFIKTVTSDKYSSVDIYMANVNETTGDFFDKWEKTLWSSCYHENEIPKLEWNGQILNIPMNAETKLVNRYGGQWRIPRNVKNGGKTPRKL